MLIIRRGRFRDARQQRQFFDEESPSGFGAMAAGGLHSKLVTREERAFRYGEMIRLRDVEPGDLPLFFEHQRDPVAVAMVAFQSRDREEFEAHWAKLLADDSLLKKTVLVDEQVVGHVGSWTAEGKREIGYWLDRALWGRGIATKALREFLRLERTRPLYAGVAKHNLGSIRVLEKCGFTLSPVDNTDADATHLILRLHEM